MITKTEVLKAIADCERSTGWGSLDHSLATDIQKGALFVLIEAAKCAKYRNITTYRGISGADFALDDSPEPAIGKYVEAE